MPQKTRRSTIRKLQKQRLNTRAIEEDFIYRLSAKKLLERVTHPDRLKNRDNDDSTILLYERDAGMLSEMSGTGENIDQLPFQMLKEKPERLMAMLPSEQYTRLLSNLVFDWVDAGAFIRLMESLLKPDGAFWFSSFGPRTAHNTRSLLSVIDPYAHFNAFYDLQDIGDALLGAGFKDVVLESSLVYVEYLSADALLADALRVFGVNTNPEQRKSLTPKSLPGEFRRRIEEVIRAESVFIEQVEILIAHGKKPVIPGMAGMIPVKQGASKNTRL